MPPSVRSPTNWSLTVKHHQCSTSTAATNRTTPKRPGVKLTDVLTSQPTEPIHGDSPTSPGSDNLHDAARRYGSAVAAADAWRHVSSEADEALRLADCDTQDAINDDWEANLNCKKGADNAMGFTTEDPKSDSMDLTATGLKAEKAKLSYQRYRASAMRAEVLYARAQSEAEAAEQHLLEVSRATYSSAAEQAVVLADMVAETTGSITHR